MTNKSQDKQAGQGSGDYPTDSSTVARIRAAAVKAEELQRLQHRTPEQQRAANLAWLKSAGGAR